MSSNAAPVRNYQATCTPKEQPPALPPAKILGVPTCQTTSAFRRCLPYTTGRHSAAKHRLLASALQMRAGDTHPPKQYQKPNDKSAISLQECTAAKSCTQQTKFNHLPTDCTMPFRSPSAPSRCHCQNAPHQLHKNGPPATPAATMSKPLSQKAPHNI